jgi:hypothetical protein
MTGPTRMPLRSKPSWSGMIPPPPMRIWSLPSSAPFPGFEFRTDDDVATLNHLARKGMGWNSLQALASDLAYLEAWAQAATGAALPWPASESLALKFAAHHL